MAVQARTLEFYRQFGFADEMIKCGVVVRRAHMREAGANGKSHEVLCLEFGDLGAGISPYPSAYFSARRPRTFPQRKTRGDLQCRRMGHWPDRPAAKRQRYRRDGDRTPGRKTVTADYICGCDGAHSKVRHSFGLGFAGATYEQLFFVCDAQVANAGGDDLNVFLGERGLQPGFRYARRACSASSASFRPSSTTATTWTSRCCVTRWNGSWACMLR